MRKLLTFLLGWLWSVSILTAQAQSIAVAGALPLRTGTSATLTAPGGASYVWTRNNADVVGYGQSLSVQAAGYYRVQVGGQTYGPVRITTQAGGSGDKNYMQEEVVLEPGITSEEAVARPQTKKVTTITYGDGLVRPLQQVKVKASVTGQDVVQFFDYDASGRQPRLYLPYTGGSDGSFKANPLAAQQAFYNGTPNVIKEPNGITYGEAVYEDTPAESIIEQSSPGSSWQVARNSSGQSTFSGHTRRTITRAVLHGEVAVWTYTPAADGVIGTATVGIAPASSLTVTQQTDEDGKLSWRYVNLLGQVLAAESYVSPGKYLTTSYAYDLAGRQVMMMTPEGVKRIVNDGQPLTSAFLDKWAYLTKYDGLGRAIARKGPGKGWEFVVYDRWDRPVATQDANYRQQSWAFTKYDELNRAVMTGRLTSTLSREQLSEQVENAIATGNTGRYENRADNTTSAVRIGYTLNKSWPTTATVNDLYTVSYFDDYSFLNNTQASLQYQAEAASDLVDSTHPATVATLAVGLPTITQMRTLGTTTWLTAVNYYDDRGQVIQTKRENQLGGVERLSTEFDYTGKVLSTYTAHQVTASGPAHTIRYRYTYYDNNQTKELFGWFNKRNGTTEQLLSKREYNELGQLVDDKLGVNQGTGKYLQSVDYRYNIRGWLTYLNNRDLLDGVAMDNVTTANTDPDAEADLFGLELKYDTDLHTGAATSRFNGNIAESMWRSRRDNQLRGYGYEYDDANRITNARYAAYVPGAGWTGEKDDVGSGGSAGNLGRFTTKDIGYDLNGNITQMDRVGRKATPSPSQAVFGLIDQLRYSYEGNRLQSVTDQAGPSAAPNDFEDGNPTGVDYSYDANGNMTADANKGLTITYNELNLPSRVQMAAGKSITFVYSATGQKLSQTVSNGTTTLQTTYVGNFVYAPAAMPQLSVATPVGRALYGATPDNATRRWIPEYHIRDQLGNLRLAFRDEGQTTLQNLTATMESVNATKEEQVFDNLTATRQLDPSHARTGSYAARLNAGQSQRMFGPSTSVSVQAGDSVHFEVYGRYELKKKAAALPIIIPLAAIATEPMAPSQGEIRPTATKSILPKLAAGITLAWTAIPNLFQRQESVPRASIKYDFYDKDSVLVSSEVKYLEQDAADAWQKVEVGFKAKQEGYVLVSIQNASKQDVWFDDAALRTTTDLIVQENHYDPWGQNLVDIETTGSPNEVWQYNNKERIADNGLEWVDYGWRMHDPQLGRWHVIDPLADLTPGLSPYAYGLNNPVLHIDADGRIVPLVVAAAFVIGGTMNLWSNWGKVKGFGSGAAYFLAGGVGGAVSAIPGMAVAGGAITATANVGIDIATGNLPDFHDPIETIKYVGLTALSGVSAGGAGSFAKLTVNSVKYVMQEAWRHSSYTIGQSILRHVAVAGAPQAMAIDLAESVIVATSTSTMVAATASTAATLASVGGQGSGGGGGSSGGSGGGGSGNIPKPNVTGSESFANQALDDATNLTMKQKSSHIFEGTLHPKPYLDQMANQVGGRANLVRTALGNANGSFPASGYFQIPTNVNGVGLTIRGFVNGNGIPIVNTMFIP
jgi:RHS repeat-associated protein